MSAKQSHGLPMWSAYGSASGRCGGRKDPRKAEPCLDDPHKTFKVSEGNGSFQILLDPHC